MAGDEYSIADMAICPWYGAVVRGETYNDAAVFLSAQDYTHVVRWTKAFYARPAVKRGRMVNKPFGDPATQLLERHDASDFELRTQDKVLAAAEK